MGLSPSKPPSLTENFPHDPASYEAKICFDFCGDGVMGEVFYFRREVIFRWCGFAPDWWVGCVRNNALHECRDPARRRPFGVRLNAAGVCSEMTQRRIAQ